MLNNANKEKIIEMFATKGQMGALIAEFDWSKTSIGSMDNWPQNLRTALSITLDSHYPMCIWWGQDQTCIYNDAWRPILGKDKHPQALGSPGRNVFPEIWDIIGMQMKTITETGQAMYFDDLLLPYQRFGYLEEAYFTYSYSPIRNEAGKTEGIFTAVLETTERYINERRVATLRDLGKAILGKTDNEVSELYIEILNGNRHDIPFAAIYLFLENGEEATKKCSFGVSSKNPLLADEISLLNSSKVATAIAHSMSTKAPAIFSIAGEEGFSNEPWGEALTSAAIVPCFFMGTQKPFGFLVVGMNVRRAFDHSYAEFFMRVGEKFSNAIVNARSFDEERKRAEKLAELDRSKTLFFSNISHEFRTPLTLLLGPIENALSSESKSLGGEDLQLAYRNALRLLKLVNTLLDFSRIEAGRMEVSYEPTDLSQLTADLASIFRSAIERAGLKLEVDCPTVGEPVFVDQEMWEKIVLNLISNAIKFTLEGTISVVLKRKGNAVELSIKDTGIGIAKEELSRVFERFHRVENVRARSQEGSGIGLSLVQELVKLHGGQLRVESTLGKGSTFYVELPLGTKHLAADRIVATKTLSSTSAGATAYLKDAEAWLAVDEPSLVLLLLEMEERTFFHPPFFMPSSVES